MGQRRGCANGRSIGWGQKKQIQQREVVGQWQQMAATRKEGKVAEAVAEAAVKAPL